MFLKLHQAKRWGWRALRGRESRWLENTRRIYRERQIGRDEARGEADWRPRKGAGAEASPGPACFGNVWEGESRNQAESDRKRKELQKGLAEAHCELSPS